MHRFVWVLLPLLAACATPSADPRDPFPDPPPDVKLHNAGRYAEAEPIARDVLARRTAALGPAHPSVARAQASLAWTLTELGRMGEAEPLARRALATREALHGDAHAEVADSLDQVGAILHRAGRSPEAEPFHRRALTIREKALGPDHPATAGSIATVAGYAIDAKRYAEAEALYKRALAAHERARGPRHPSVAYDLYNLAITYTYMERLREADALIARARGILEAAHGPEHPEVARFLNNWGIYLAVNGRAAEGEPMLRRAVAIDEKALGPAHPSLGSQLYNLAWVTDSKGDVGEALALARRSTAIKAAYLDGGAALGAATAAGLPRSWRGEHFLHLDLAQRAAAAASGAERDRLLGEALEQLQRATATATGAVLARMAARFAAGSDALAALAREQQDAAERLHKADSDLLAVIAQPAATRDRARETALRAETESLRARIGAIAARLEREHPAYAALASPRPLGLGTLQALLRPDEALLAFAVAERTTAVLAVRRDRIRAARVEIGAGALADAARRLRAGLDPTERRDLAELPPFDAAGAHELYRLLLAPVADALAGADHLLAVPDGPLGSLPFSLLLTAAPERTTIAPGDTAAFRAAPWLMRRHAVTTLPSVGALQALRHFAGSARAPLPFLGIGDPLLKDHPADPAGGPASRRAAGPAKAAAVGWSFVEARPPALRSLFRGATADPEALRQVPSLPETAGELAAMATALGASSGSLALRERATEATVRSGLRLAQYRVIAFATHGVVAGEIQGLAEPALILTPPLAAAAADVIAGDDGLLTAGEIATLKLDADWVILSACNTAAPDGTPGAEGLSGLAKAFFHAGARALLVSHWPVISDAAVALTTTMLREAARPGVGRAQAHRSAMLAMLADTTGPARAHPVFWAPFVVVGDSGGQ